MAVLLSPVGGVAAQFFTNAGVPLSGGKIYTYAAGTSTPQATYTTGAGLVQHSNPIVLDAAGRVPTGEIWLTDGFSYKFVLKDYNDVLIGTYDNIVGINSNFVNYVNSQEIQTATAGQTVFNLTTMQYQPGTGNLSVFVDGVNQYGPGAQYAYTETDQDTVTFVSGLHVGASVKFTSTQIQNSGIGDASQITYTYPSSNAVEQSVEERLAQYVSVKDFGAVGDGVTDDTTAFANALSFCKANSIGINIPDGTYLLESGQLNFGYTNLAVVGIGKPTLKFTGTGKGFEVGPLPVAPGYFGGARIENLIIEGSSTITDGFYSEGLVRGIVRNVEVKEVTSKAFAIYGGVSATYDNIKYSAAYDTNKATYGLYVAGTPSPSTSYTADCTFINPIIEDSGNTLCYVFEGSGNSFVGGTFEGGSTGLVIGTTSRINYFESVWFELNTVKDVEVAGTSNSFNNCNFSSASSLLNFIVSTGKNTSVYNGYIRAANLQSTSSDTLFVGCAFDQNTGGGLGIQGNGTYKCLGLTKADNSGLVVGTMPDVLGETASFTGTATGLTTTETGTIAYQRLGNQVTLRLPQFAGTSNATTFTITGLPTTIRPSNTETCLVRVRDNSGTIVVGVAEIASTGVITLYSSPGLGAWTASGTKGLFASDITYYRQ